MPKYSVESIMKATGMTESEVRNYLGAEICSTHQEVMELARKLNEDSPISKYEVADKWISLCTTKDDYMSLFESDFLKNPRIRSAADRFAELLSDPEECKMYYRRLEVVLPNNIDSLVGIMNRAIKLLREEIGIALARKENVDKMLSWIDVSFFDGSIVLDMMKKISESEDVLCSLEAIKKLCALITKHKDSLRIVTDMKSNNYWLPENFLLDLLKSFASKCDNVDQLCYILNEARSILIKFPAKDIKDDLAARSHNEVHYKAKNLVHTMVFKIAELYPSQ
jgi:hypothetical protein